MSDHKCLGLHHCVNHPKWTVTHGYGLWFAYAPYAFENAGYFRTWREAFDFARQEATR